MSRKAQKNIAIDQEQKPAAVSAEVLESLKGVSLAASGSAETAILRRTYLQNYTPKRTGAAVIAVLRPQLIDAVLQVDFTSKGADKAMAHAFFLFGNWCIQSRGGFNTVTDLNALMFEEFRVQVLSNYGASSEATHMSALKRILRKTTMPKGRNRVPASPPFSKQQWASLYKAASESGRYATDATTLLVLSGGLGLKSHEIVQVKGSWLHTVGNRTSITVIDKNSCRRELPIYGRDAEWLRGRADEGPDEYLLRPTVQVRRNTIGNLVWNLTRAHGEFEDFTVPKARHMWLLNLMTTNIPFHVVCAMAGIGTDSNLPGDLIGFAPTVRVQDMRYHLEPSGYINATAYLTNTEGNLS